MFLGETKLALTANLLKNRCSRRAVPEEAPSGLFSSAAVQRNSTEAVQLLPGSSGLGGIMKSHLTIPLLARKPGWQENSVAQQSKLVDVAVT